MSRVAVMFADCKRKRNDVVMTALLAYLNMHITVRERLNTQGRLGQDARSCHIRHSFLASILPNSWIIYKLLRSDPEFQASAAMNPRCCHIVLS